MTSKYELTISTNWVPDWGCKEAIREIIQNALDNEATSENNKAVIEYDEGNEILSISNKNGALELSTLLIGNSTKANDTRTIGKHGEGYKIGIMVLLRSGLQVRVLNYNKNEVWVARLVRSKRFGDELVPTIFVEKEANFWEKKPESTLSFVIKGVTKEVYEEVVRDTLMLHNREADERIDVMYEGTKSSILMSPDESGRIYVGGLYICSEEQLQYGYDIHPSLVDIDRDRRMMREYDIFNTTSLIWKQLCSGTDKYDKDIAQMCLGEVNDVKYFQYKAASYVRKDSESDEAIADATMQAFEDEYGGDAYPVTDEDAYESASKAGFKPVIVREYAMGVIKRSEVYKEKSVTIAETEEKEIENVEEVDFDSLEEELEDLTEEICGYISKEQYKRMKSVLLSVRNLKSAYDEAEYQRDELSKQASDLEDELLRLENEVSRLYAQLEDSNTSPEWESMGI